uniref:MYND-type domain-containing protein n=1 Tax=Mycena chlorophos TaxID=658473 RepID=A0ABQ0KX71_MYCCL|nr:predicted protein [Mycena chlorophos]
MSSPSSLSIRPASPADIPRITSILNHYISSSVTTFRLDPVAEATVLDTHHAISAQGLPYLVAYDHTSDNTILGYTYAAGYRMPSHAGYQHTVEISVFKFVAPDSRTRGVGTALMDALIPALRTTTNPKVHQVLAVMAVDPDGQDAGLGLRDWYGRWGFKEVGRLKRVGYKFGKWLDTMFLQLSLDEKDLAFLALGGDLWALKRLTHTKLTNSDLARKLPLYLALLYAEDIRVFQALEDSDSASTKHRLLQVTMAVEGLSFVILRDVVPAAAYADIWPRILAWSAFIDEYREQLPLFEYPTLEGVSRKPGVTFLHLHILMVTDKFGQGTCHLPQAELDRRLFYLAGRAYPELFRSATPVEDLQLVSSILSRESIKDPGSLAALLAGLCGTTETLAFYIVQQLKLVMNHHPILQPFSDAQLRNIVGLQHLLYITSNRDGVGAELCRSLGQAGIVPVLTRVNLVLASHPLNENVRTTTLTDLFFALTNHFLNPNPQKFVIQALRAGLLPLCFGFSYDTPATPLRDRRFHKGTLYALLEPVFEDDTGLSAFTVYSSVVRQLQASLPDVQHLNAEQHFVLGGVVDEWNAFHSVARRRIDLYARFKAGHLEDDERPARVCDNFSCGAFDGSALKTCGNCNQLLYCSKMCQRQDWKNGHRTECERWKRFLAGSPSLMGRSDQEFLRVILNHHYRALQLRLMTATLPYLRQNPTKFPVMTWKFFGPEPLVEICPATEPMLMAMAGPASGRAARSGGRVQLHLLAFPEGLTHPYRHVFLHFSDTSLLRKLANLAARTGDFDAERLEGYVHAILSTSGRCSF